MFKLTKIKHHEKGFLFKDNEFVTIVGSGLQVTSLSTQIRKYSIRDVWITDPDLKVLIDEDRLDKDQVETLVLKSDERAFIWIDGVFDRFLLPGYYAYWKNSKAVTIEKFNVRNVWIDHKDLPVWCEDKIFDHTVNNFTLLDNQRALVWVDDKFEKIIGAGTYALWNILKKVKVSLFDIHNFWIENSKLKEWIDNDIFNDSVTTIEIKDDERAFVWLDGTFNKMLTPGFYAYWNGVKDVKIEKFNIDEGPLEHKDVKKWYKAGIFDQTVQVVDLKDNERALLWIDGHFKGLLTSGVYAYWQVRRNIVVNVYSIDDPVVIHPKLESLINDDAFGKCAQIIDLKDNERGLLWVDKRFDRILGPGVYALWNERKDITLEVVKNDPVRFTHDNLTTILKSPRAEEMLTILDVDKNHVALTFENGKYAEQLQSGTYAFWNGGKPVKSSLVPSCETVRDITGQEIMTSDKVTLRINLVVNTLVVDPYLAVTSVDDVDQAVYRESQLIIRSLIGVKTLDELLAQKDEISTMLIDNLQKQCKKYGMKIVSAGIRDIILPGDMKELLNRVVEAKKHAEANLIVRREETAAMRSQANTARLIENNPTLMRIKELETIEKIAEKSRFTINVGEKGLSESVLRIV